MVSIKAPSHDKETNMSVASNSQQSKLMDNQYLGSDGGGDKTQPLQILDPNKPKHEAALKVQKVYKSFRTRRKLADCAILVEEMRWKLYDSNPLKGNSISSEIEKHKTAISRWSRAGARVARVKKVLSRKDKDQQLALQDWPEATFLLIDVGEGKEINLEECNRPKLQQQHIKYLGPSERLAYEVIKDGKFLYKRSGELLHATGEADCAKWIFVLSPSMALFVGKKKKGTFHYSSFLAGGATIAAGRLVVDKGILKVVWPRSDYYLSTEENVSNFISFLKEKEDLADVEINPVDEQDGLLSLQTSSGDLRTNSSESQIDNLPPESPEDGCESAAEGFTSEQDNMDSQQSSFGEEDEVTEVIPEESNLKRINSHGVKSYQLGKQLSRKWATGAGRRIVCVGDYPPELQLRALKQVNLSP